MRFLLDENLSPLHARTIRGMVLLTLDADFANVLRYPPAETPGVVRLLLHPATEEAIDEMLRSAIRRVAEVSVRGKLLVVDGRRIRIRG